MSAAVKRGGLVVLALAAVAALIAGGLVVSARASGPDVAKVRAAVARYEQPAQAQKAGWDLVEGLDDCFENEGVGGMGYHYINVDLLDTSLDPETPEALVYVPRPDGGVRLGAVEYIVPAQPWDDEGHEGLPSVLDHELHLNEALGVYVLHAWILEKNPAGMFEDWHPEVSCPTS